MKPFLNDHFLLQNKTAEILYHDYAADLPILDYHNHLPPQEIAENRVFENITRVWLNGDHYKWRAMRTLGIPEAYITGEASDAEKFQRWAETVPFTFRNPLYHWTHLELKRYFGISTLLTGDSAPSIFKETAAMLADPGYSTRGLLQKMRVEVVCTTDDPVDNLSWHRQFGEEQAGFRMLPAFRPDKAIIILNPAFPAYLQTLGEASGVAIHTFADLLDALEKRMDWFEAHGCRLADHGLEQMYADTFSTKDLDTILQKRLKGEMISPAEASSFMSGMLYYLGVSYARRGWVQQFHLGALRNNNSRMLRHLGPDTGFDSIGDWEQAVPLARYLDRLDREDQLARTIIYNLNPRDNEVFATMIGNFNDGSIRGKVQFGSAWWFLDQKDGIEKQLNALSNMGLLATFIGMLTDSRSFLSFPRHEYFRRILCNMIGQDVEEGLLPDDTKWLGSLIQGICYGNARSYFDF